MNEYVDQRILGEFRVFRNPIADALHDVAFEEFDIVVAEIGFESFKLALIAVVSPEFIDARLRPGAGGEQREQQKQFCGHKDL